MNFDFKTYPPLKNLKDRDFWNMKSVIINGKPNHGYSRTTRLIFAFFKYEGETDIHMQLIGWKNNEGKLIPAKKCNIYILDWCRKSKIVV